MWASLNLTYVYETMIYHLSNELFKLELHGLVFYKLPDQLTSLVKEVLATCVFLRAESDHTVS